MSIMRMHITTTVLPHDSLLQILFKMDVNGDGMLIEKCKLNLALGLQADVYSFEKFRYMCILSGCDYLASLHGIGLAKANKVFKLTRNPDIEIVSTCSLNLNSNSL